MCGRFALKAPPAKLIQVFELDECVDFLPHPNIAPGTDIPVIRFSPEGKRVLHLLRWGLVPHWAKDASIGAKLHNARGETLSEKPSFREAFKKRRCLIPADGFYEWKTEGKTKQPYCFSLKSKETMALAGLWESWRAPDGSILRSVTIITMEANEMMRPIHHRMPMILGSKDWREWLGTTPIIDAIPIVKPAEIELQKEAVRRLTNAEVQKGVSEFLCKRGFGYS